MSSPLLSFFMNNDRQKWCFIFDLKRKKSKYSPALFFCFETLRMMPRSGFLTSKKRKILSRALFSLQKNDRECSGRIFETKKVFRSVFPLCYTSKKDCVQYFIYFPLPFAVFYGHRCRRRGNQRNQILFNFN